jgi:DNA-binding SARP family transcriptional activator
VPIDEPFARERAVPDDPLFALTLFGGISLRGLGRELDALLVNTKAVGLLAYLAIPTQGRFVRRDTLVALLWPELDQGRARTALRKTVHAVRQATAPEVLLSRGDEEIALSPTLLWCDVAAFTAAADAGFLLQALQLYRGELMPGFHLSGSWDFERFLDDERNTARERASAAAWALAQRFETDQQLSDAAGMARQSVRFSWSDERALRRAVAMLDRLGDRAGALRLYEEFSRRLREDLGAEPSRETMDLAHRVRTGLPA